GGLDIAPPTGAAHTFVWEAMLTFLIRHTHGKCNSQVWKFTVDLTDGVKWPVLSELVASEDIAVQRI
ncbi:hypothetical protein, partial [Acidomonas methanolica]|uniref:hypothetical protein n=1 Tax=Acidomonas methanolica TaxID=437 RepID=UPI0022303B5E